MSLLLGLGAGLGDGLWPRAFRQQGSLGRTARACLGTDDPRRNPQRQQRRGAGCRSALATQRGLPLTLYRVAIYDGSRLAAHDHRHERRSW